MAKDVITDEQKKELEKLIGEINNQAKEVVKDYAENPSQMSGSVTQVHEDSPLLKDNKKLGFYIKRLYIV